MSLEYHDEEKPFHKPECLCDDCLAWRRANGKKVPGDGGHWRPIETAPKDGTELLLFARYYGPFLGRWFEDNRGGGAYWAVGCCMAARPSHWMPLPLPPEE